MRPVSSHRKQISDFCSWNGLLVLAGVRTNAKSDRHVFADANHSTALWFGGVDDLWKLGKPVGRGGPWHETEVKANVPSDPYLMTGYDQKSVQMSHGAARSITITLEIDINGNGLWVKYKSFKIPQGAAAQYEFPPAFSACWVRAVSDTETSATVQFDYR